MQPERLGILTQQLQKIERVITTASTKCIDLANGDAGISLFYFYLYQLTGKRSYLNSCQRLIINAINELPELNQYCLEKGLFGIAWTASMLNNKKAIKLTENDFFAQVDHIVYITSLRYIMDSALGFWNGGLGAVIMAFTRLSDDRAMGYLDQLNEILESYPILEYYGDKLSVISTESGEVSQSSLRSINDLIAILKILIKIHSKKIFYPKQEPEISPIIDLVIRYFEQTDEWLTHTNGLQPSNLVFSRLQFALALLDAERSFDLPNLHNTAIGLIRDVMQTENSFAFNGPCLEGGTAGLAHLYNRIYGYTRDPLHLERANKWMEQTLQEIGSPDLMQAGFLYGLAGIGLVLISSVSPDSTPCWDECFVIAG